jgi:HPt (histidine-containing phosphotransfer) domain-containing protein
MDLSKLREVRASDDGVDEALLTQLLGMFLTDNRLRVDELIAAATAGDHDLVRRLAHAIAGSAGTAGAFTLAGLARAIATAAASGQAPHRDRLQAVRGELGRVEAVVCTRYPSLNLPA